MPRDEASLLDIFRAGQRIVEFAQGFSRAALETDVMRLSAILYQIQIVGEATKRLSVEFREQHSEIPWRQVAGMRDIIAHHYDRLDLESMRSVTCALFFAAGKPRRTIADANISGVISGQSDKSMSESVIASSRCQSVWELLEKDSLFILSCLPCRNNADGIATLGMDNSNKYPLQQAKRNKTLLTIVITIIFNRYCISIKHFSYVNKIDTMLANICKTLCFIPFKLYQQIAALTSSL